MKAVKFLIFFLILCGLLIPANELYGITGKLLAGTAKVNITPKENKPFHDSLYARCLVLDINGQRLAFVSVDLGIYTSADLEKICREKYGIAQVLISSSHTYSASGRRTDTFFEDQIVSAVGKAIKNMFPARISDGHLNQDPGGHTHLQLLSNIK